ncbi:MAG TPA: hypothetical protein PKY81_03720 [bacterium]|nr:hypothetical protein [bacterium]
MIIKKIFEISNKINKIKEISDSGKNIGIFKCKTKVEIQKNCNLYLKIGVKISIILIGMSLIIFLISKIYGLILFILFFVYIITYFLYYFILKKDLLEEIEEIKALNSEEKQGKF